jgi:hypothetical protein
VERPPSAEPIGLVHNGFHVDHRDRFRDLHDFARRDQLPEPGRTQYDEDPETYGRHAMPTRD